MTSAITRVYKEPDFSPTCHSPLQYGVCCAAMTTCSDCAAVRRKLLYVDVALFPLPADSVIVATSVA